MKVHGSMALCFLLFIHYEGSRLHWIDFSLVILFLVSFSIFGFWQVNKNKSSGDYFLAGKDLPWPVAMLSIVATETSVLTFISVPGLAFRGEWFFLQLGFGYIIGRILVSIFLLPSYFDFGVVSIYEVIGRRYGLFFQKVASKGINVELVAQLQPMLFIRIT